VNGYQLPIEKKCESIRRRLPTERWAGFGGQAKFEKHKSEKAEYRRQNLISKNGKFFIYKIMLVLVRCQPDY
jgi:hypothetical protein